jgi:putative flippase GtrA
MIRPETRQLARDLFGYGCVSALALVVDTGLLWALYRHAGVHYLLAASISFTAGAVLAWWLSTRFVFTLHQLANRGAEFVAFVALGLVGLCVNIAVLAFAVQWLRWPVLAGKMLAVSGTFLCNFLLRRQLLFSAQRRLAVTEKEMSP